MKLREQMNVNGHEPPSASSSTSESSEEEGYGSSAKGTEARSDRTPFGKQEGVQIEENHNNISGK
eukprot:scaffold127579_cov18-Prasinocladus_malaysianus.AAC.1